MREPLTDVLKRVAELVGEDVAVDDPDRIARSMARAFRSEIEQDRYVSGAAFGRLLGISKQAVQQRASRGTLLVLADEGGVRYPVWQLVDGRPARGLALLIRESHRRGVGDAALIRWLEGDPERMRRFEAGEARVLAGELPRRRAQVNRRRVDHPAPSIRG